MTFTVYVDDNFHFSDDDERCLDSTHDTAEAAVARCKKIVECELQDYLRRGYSVEEIAVVCCMFGDESWIMPGVGFSALAYAEQYAKTLKS